MKIAILCAAETGNYPYLSNKYNLEIFTKEKDCRNFKFDCPVITHAPCAQWSRLKGFARSNEDEKNLAWFCKKAVDTCGGIFEHPSDSSFFRESNCEISKIYSVNLSWFGYMARKKTLLYYNQVSLLSHPLSFNAITHQLSTNKNGRSLPEIKQSERHITPLEFNEWLIQSIIHSYQVK